MTILSTFLEVSLIFLWTTWKNTRKLGTIKENSRIKIWTVKNTV